MNEKPRILVLTLSFGAGHVSAAQAIIAEFQKQIPAADLRMIDALEDCPFWFRAVYVWTYWAMIRYAPRVWEKFFASRVERRDEQTAPVWMWKKGCRKVFDEIKNFQPELIVACEVGASEIAVIARRENSTTAEIINVITDFEAEPIWVKPEIAAYSVANETVKTQLVNWSADQEKIKICGIPLNASFTETHNSQNTRARFDLDDRPIILLMGGGMGPTRMDEVAAEILKTGKNLNVVALPGKDARAKATLEKLSDSETVNLRVIDWTNEVAALMQAASILATKPGGVTLSEAAACELPLVLFDAIPGPETINARKFVEAGAAILAKNSTDAARQILRLLADEERLKLMSENCRALSKTDAASEIVRLAASRIDFSKTANVSRFAPKKLSTSRRVYGFLRRLKKTENSPLGSANFKQAEALENFQTSSSPEVEIG